MQESWNVRCVYPNPVSWEIVPRLFLRIPISFHTSQFQRHWDTRDKMQHLNFPGLSVAELDSHKIQSLECALWSSLGSKTPSLTGSSCLLTPRDPNKKQVHGIKDASKL